MAIDQDRTAKIALQPHEEPAQRPVVRLIKPINAPHRFRDRNTLIIDFLGIAHHARDRAEPACHPH